MLAGTPATVTGANYWNGTPLKRTKPVWVARTNCPFCTAVVPLSAISSMT
jgi:hypothetical protein